MTSSDPTHLPGYALGMEAAARIVEADAARIVSETQLAETVRIRLKYAAISIRQAIPTANAQDADPVWLGLTSIEAAWREGQFDAFSDGPGPSLDGVMPGDLNP